MAGDTPSPAWGVRLPRACLRPARSLRLHRGPQLHAARTPRVRLSGDARLARHRPRRDRPAFRLRHGQRRHAERASPSLARTFAASLFCRRMSSDRVLADCAAGGIRGVRLSDMTAGGVPLAHLEAMAARVKSSGWHIQIFAEFSKDTALPGRIRKLGVPVVIDHFGVVDPQRGVADAGFQAVLNLLRDGVCWLKMSAPYIMSRQSRCPSPTSQPFADGACRGGAGSARLGHRLAASRLRRLAAERCRSPGAPRSLGARRRAPQAHPRRQSGRALRLSAA